MRYSKTHKQEMRQQLVERAGALAKTQGFAASGVDSLARSAGLSGAGLYAHFSNKTQLLDAIVSNELSIGAQRLGVDETSEATPELAQVLSGLSLYLSQAHVQLPQMGCILPTLLPEIARSDLSTKEVFAQGLELWADRLLPLMPDKGKLYSVFALLAGTVALARALPDPALKDQLLQRSLQWVTELIIEEQGKRKKVQHQ